MMVRSRIKCVFRLSGFSCDPDEITKSLRLSPTRSWSVGDVVPGTSMNRPAAGWEISTRLSEDRDLSDQVDDIVSQLIPVKQAIKGLQYGGSSVISCAVYVHEEDRPSIYISKSTVSEIAEIGADLDIDLYIVSCPLLSQEGRFPSQ